MTTFTFGILGGNYERAGSASRQLKELLRTVGAEPQAARRAISAAYEAEMNVVIHAHHGRMHASLLPGRLEVEVVDQGPGIANIELAMRPGWSTAPQKARELGFGAGLGLPNIKKNSDLFVLESAVGKGCRVMFAVSFRPSPCANGSLNSLRLSAELCRACLRCVHACPMSAVRVRVRAPVVLPHLCVDCPARIDVCPTGAIGMEASASRPENAADTTLIVPSPLLLQFAGYSAEAVLGAVSSAGFKRVRLVDPWNATDHQALLEQARARDGAPVISGSCPAIVNLIATRFPSLLSGLSTLRSPLEAAVATCQNEPLLVVALCPSQCSLLHSMGVAPSRVATPAAFRRLLQPLLERQSPSPVPAQSREADAACAGVLQVFGMRHCSRVLEALENGLLGSANVLDLYGCEMGCHGSPLLLESPFVSHHRWRLGEARAPPTEPMVRTEPVKPRSGFRLDSDMSTAMQKLARMSEVLRTLPGDDCGCCGAPSCRAQAEDVALGRISGAGCARLQPEVTP